MPWRSDATAWPRVRGRRRLGGTHDDVVHRIFDLERQMLRGPENEAPLLPSDAVEAALPRCGKDHLFLGVLRLLVANAEKARAAASERGGDDGDAPRGGGERAVHVAESQRRAARRIELIGKYRTLLQDIGKALARRRAALSPGRAADQEFLRTLLALARTNLAGDMADAGQSAAEVEQAFQAALDVQARPARGYTLRQMAEWYIGQEKWEEARQASDAAVSVDPGKDSDTARFEFQPWLASRQASALHGQGKYHAADVTLRTALRDAAVRLPEKRDWQGLLRNRLADCLSAQGLDAEAAAELERGAADYEGAGDLRSAAALHDKRARLLETRADALVQSRHDAQARAAYADALRSVERSSALLQPPPPGVAEQPPAAVRRQQSGLLARIGLLRLHLGEAAGGRAALAMSRQLVPGWEVFNPDQRIVEAELHRTVDGRPDLEATLKAYLASEMRSAAGDQARRRDLIDAWRVLLARSAALATEDDGMVWQAEGGQRVFPSPFPIRLRAPGNAVGIPMPVLGGPLATHPDSVTECLGWVRERVLAGFGVRLPHMQVQENDDPSDERVVLLINDVQRDSLDLAGAAGAVAGLEGALAARGIHSIRAVPCNVPAHYVDAEGLRRARAEGLATWTLMDCIMAWLEAALPAFLAELLDHQEVQRLQEYGERPDGRKLVSVDRVPELVAFEAHDHMAPLTRLVRALVAERVPVNDFGAIHAAFLQGMRRSDTVEATTARIRLDRRERLWGNEDGRRALLLLPQPWTAFLRTAAAASLTNGAVTVPSDALRTFQGRIAGLLRDGEGNGIAATGPALVVGDGSCRPLVRAALEAAFPNLPVLALEEVRPERVAALEPAKEATVH